MLAFKKIISYLVDVKLATASTPLNPEIELSLRKGRYYLTTPNAVYSYGDLYGNFLQTFKKLDFSNLKLNELLVLGFGMGSVPLMLEKIFHQKFNCWGVEADAQILEWAKTYSIPEISSPINLHHLDAALFIENNTKQFDLVVVDLFLDDLVPEKFESASFLRLLKNSISENGLLLFNRLADTVEAESSTKRFYENSFLSVFPKGSYLEVGGNWMLANHKFWE